MRGRYSMIHTAIAKYGFDVVFAEYKKRRVREFCRKYNMSHSTVVHIFGPKMTRSKKVMVKLLQQEGDTRKVCEIASGNIL